MINKYQRNIKGVTVDVYDVLMAWGVTNPALQHAIKKLLQPGQRGAKGVVQDLTESIQALGRAIELENSAQPVIKIPSIYVYGPPGCGKSTNAKAIMKHFGLTRLVDEYSNGHSKNAIADTGELILGIGAANGPKFIRRMTYRSAMKAVKAGAK